MICAAHVWIARDWGVSLTRYTQLWQVSVEISVRLLVPYAREGHIPHRGWRCAPTLWGTSLRCSPSRTVLPGEIPDSATAGSPGEWIVSTRVLGAGPAKSSPRARVARPCLAQPVRDPPTCAPLPPRIAGSVQAARDNTVAIVTLRRYGHLDGVHRYQFCTARLYYDCILPVICEGWEACVWVPRLRFGPIGKIARVDRSPDPAGACQRRLKAIGKKKKKKTQTASSVSQHCCQVV